MAAAKFNTNIETPANKIVATYDLDSVITKYGFGDLNRFDYELSSKIVGTSVSGNILLVSDYAYGTISVIVKAGELSATASIKLYGFYATKLEILNTDSTIKSFENALKLAKENWSTLVGAKKAK